MFILLFFLAILFITIGVILKIKKKDKLSKIFFIIGILVFLIDLLLISATFIFLGGY